MPGERGWYVGCVYGNIVLVSLPLAFQLSCLVWSDELHPDARSHARIEGRHSRMMFACGCTTSTAQQPLPALGNMETALLKSDK